jgi:hypothetical protein
VVVALVVGLAVLAGGVFAGIKLFGGHGDDAVHRAAPSGQPSDAGAGSRPGLPAISDADATDQIRRLLVDYHQDIVDDDFRAAFALLSARKQRSALRQYGFDGWQRGQATLAPYLQPAGLRVAIVTRDAVTGVVLVRVTGMGYTKQDSPCTTWSGLTWVKYENGEFRYDPGYGTTPQRTRDWSGRQSELLGVGC